MMQPELRVALVDMSWPGYRSLALGYLRAYAAADPRLSGRAGFTTLELDSDTDPWWVAYRLDDLEPDVVGFSVTCWNARSVFDAARLLAAARPGTHIVLGGPEVGPVAEQVLADHPYVDAVVRGEGEETFADVLDALLGSRPLAGVAGVSARTDDGIVTAPDRPLITDLDSIPSPYTTGVLTPVDGATYIETYRGCPHQCGYCFEGKGYGRIRKFSRGRVAEEIAAVATAPGVRSFSFIDPVFNLTDEHLRWLSDTLEPFAREGMRLHTIEVDVERIGAAQAADLRRAGVLSVETGPQSVGSAALEACKRGFDRDTFAAGVAACRARGIRVECDFIIGLPGDTADDVDDGLRFALSLDPGKIQVSTLHVLPGTDLWERAEEFGLVFDPQPPHEIVRTRDFGFSDLRRTEVFGMTLARLYGARVETDRERTTP
ncbi:MAG: radical SAM protein [Coriobacteriia bacterium]|nr:radical SAM protein [Coriobacteriia bacterium]